jgi:PAS domain S-box-containing protein
MDDHLEQPDEIADLRRRLAEAEATLDALRAGEVDAIVVSGEAGEQVFTLKGEVHRFSEFIEKVTEGAVLLGADGLILYANTPFARLVGKSSDTLQGESLLNIIEPDQRYRLKLLLGQPDRSLMDAEFNLKTEHQRSIPVRLFSFADPADPEEVCLIVYDLTKQKLYETQLSEAGEYTRGLIESSVDAMVVIDRDMRITDANERFAVLTAVPKTALIGSRFDGYFLEPAQATSAVNKVVSDGYVTNCDLALSTASGKELLVFIQCFAF